MSLLLIGAKLDTRLDILEINQMVNSRYFWYVF